MEGQTTREPVEAQPEEETRFQRRFVRERGAGEDALQARWARQREEFGGVSWSSAFFGWLVSVGIAAILVGLLSAAGAAFGLSDVSDAEAEANAETIGIAGALLLLVVLGAAYYFGGYVSGRLSRFDGAARAWRSGASASQQRSCWRPPRWCSARSTTSTSGSTCRASRSTRGR